MGIPAATARALSAGLGSLMSRIVGVKTSRSRNLAINSIPLITGILWSMTKQSQTPRSPARRSSVALA